MSDHWSLWQDFFRCLVTAAANADLYEISHPQVVHLRSRARAHLETLLGPGQSVGLLLLDNDIIIEKIPLPGTQHTARFAAVLKARGIEHLRVLHGISDDELTALILTLSRRGQTGAPLRSGAHLVFGTLDLADNDSGAVAVPSRPEPAGDFSAEVTATAIARFADICDSARKHRPVSIIGLSEIVSRFIRAFDRALPPLQMLVPLRMMDEYTFTHATNVCLLNLAQGKSLGLEPALLHDIGLAGLLHDVGKLFVPEEILRKPGKPTEEEWALLRQHPARGARYLLESSGIPHLAVIAAFEHHLKYNLSGYPKVAANWRQHLASHITTISDIFDALCSKRAYRNPVEIRKTTEIIRSLAGSDLHPQLTENFLGVIEKSFPETA